jgi:RNA polymerase sigma-70 factor, ECF subfamily
MGDEFGAQVEPFRRELLAHCYRMTGALSDAEDALQNALVRAWRSFDSFEGRASLRTWLYKITTNACLDLLASRKARTMPELAGRAAPADVEATGGADVDPAWLEPLPPPDSQYANREAVRLAFIVALQVLPPKQRAALILRDVVGLSAEETAATLDTSVAAINSALQRARAVLDEHPRAKRSPITGKLGDLLGNYLRLWEAGDARGLVALLREDAILSMPPLPMWAQGPDAIAHLLETLVFPRGPSRAIPCVINSAPAFAMYQNGALAAISVLDIEGDRIVAIQSFLGVDAATYGLPTTLPPDAPHDLIPGALLGGRYRLEYVLGSGGMGQVWLAHDTQLERNVALKVLRSEAAGHADMRARLLREARAMARIRDPHVLAIHDVTQLAGHDVLVMELIDGEDMARWSRRGQDDAALRAAIVAAGRGLAAVHRAGLVHRDFKPANVLVAADGRIVLGDFGLSRVTTGSPGPSARGSQPMVASFDPEQTAVEAPRARRETRDGLGVASRPPATGDDLTLTRPGTVMGTPAYMAPEVLRGEEADARTDQFAFCVSAWQLLAGGLPFSLADLESLARGTDAAPALGDRLDERTRAALLRGLARDRDARHASIDDLLLALGD